MIDIEQAKRASQYMSREQKSDAWDLRERLKDLIEQETQAFEEKYPDLQVICPSSVQVIVREEQEE